MGRGGVFIQLPREKNANGSGQSWLGRIGRLLLVGGAMAGSAVGIAVVYAIADMYLTGHGYVQPHPSSTPWHYQIFSGLLFVVPVIVGILVYRASGK